MFAMAVVVLNATRGPLLGVRGMCVRSRKAYKWARKLMGLGPIPVPPQKLTPADDLPLHLEDAVGVCPELDKPKLTQVVNEVCGAFLVSWEEAAVALEEAASEENKP